MFLEPQRHNVFRLSGTPCTNFVMVLVGVLSIGLHRLRPASCWHLAIVLNEHRSLVDRLRVILYIGHLWIIFCCCIHI